MGDQRALFDMRIGFVSQPTDVAPPVGGASISIWIEEVATRIARRCEVTVYSRQTELYPDRNEHHGVRHVRLSTRLDERMIRTVRRAEHMLGKVLRRPVDLFFRWYYFSWLYYCFYARQVGRAARAQGIDVLLVSNYSQFLGHLRRACKPIRLALMMHCDWLIELPRRTSARRTRHAAAVLGCSDYIANGVRRQFPELSSRCHTLYNGSSEEALRRDVSAEVRREAFVQSPRDKVVLFVGRITPEKGVHVLMEAMERVLRKCPECVLLIVGGFFVNPPKPRGRGVSVAQSNGFETLKENYEEYLRRQARPLGERVRFLGEIPHSQLWACYRVCDVFVHPSLWHEPFGMILTEAMLCERPVVSTRTGGIPEIVAHQETGLLVEPNDPQALSDAIIELLEDERLRRAMGQAGRRRVEERFTWDHTARRLEEILGRVGQG